MQAKNFNLSFWDDEYVASLSSNEKVLFAYFIFHPETNPWGLYRTFDSVTVSRTGLSEIAVQEGKEKFERDGKIFFLDGWVFVKNNDKHHKFKGSKNSISSKNFHKNLSPKIAKWKKQLSELNFDRGIDTQTFQYRYQNVSVSRINSDSKPVNSTFDNAQKNNYDQAVQAEKKKEKEAKRKKKSLLEKKETKDNQEEKNTLVNSTTTQEVLEFWNSVFGTELKSSSGWQKNLEFWLTQYPLEDIKRAIEVCAVDDFWKDKMTPVMFFRRRNPSGEAVDRISDLLARQKKPKPSAMSVSSYLNDF